MPQLKPDTRDWLNVSSKGNSLATSTKFARRLFLVKLTDLQGTILTKGAKNAVLWLRGVNKPVRPFPFSYTATATSDRRDATFRLHSGRPETRLSTERVIERTLPTQKFYSEDTWAPKYSVEEGGLATIVVSVEQGDIPGTSASLRLESFVSEDPTFASERRGSEEVAQVEATEAGVLLVLASEWLPRHGGLSTFNRKLCSGLAKSGADVICYVPSASSDEKTDASAAGVTLVDSPSKSDGVLGLRRKPPLGPDDEPTVIVGHDHITGDVARGLRRDFYPSAQLIQIVHTAPGEIEVFKEQPEGRSSAGRADEKEAALRDILNEADCVLCVGPKLFASTQHLLHSVNPSQKVVRIDPGFEARPSKEDRSPIPQVLLFGRGEDVLLKGLDLAVCATAKVNPSLFKRPVRLFIRGAPINTGDTLRSRLLQIAGEAGFELMVREYTTDLELLRQDIMCSSLVLMPSRAEGFGLVGLEAIELGVPVLVSRNSGLGELLLDRVPGIAQNLVLPVTENLASDAVVWGRAIERMMVDGATAIRDAASLSAELQATLSWEKTADVFLGHVAQVRRRSL